MSPRHLWTDITELIDYASVNYIPRKTQTKIWKFWKVSKTVKKSPEKVKKSPKKSESPKKSPESPQKNQKIK